jgi:hypothetical protein
MTVLETPSIDVRFRPVVLDLYRNIHKGIRAELFAVIGDAGRLDPADRCGVDALTEHVRAVVRLLEHHAETEDRHIGPALVEHVPQLADRIFTDHHAFEGRTAFLVELAQDARTATDRAGALHELYIELAAFGGTYLLHQDVEERQINPALEAAIGVEAVVGIHGAIIGNMPPQDLISALAVMLPAMNIDDRSELLGGMRQSAPRPAFDAVWSLAGSVLTTSDFRSVAHRLGLG